MRRHWVWFVLSSLTPSIGFAQEVEQNPAPESGSERAAAPPETDPTSPEPQATEPSPSEAQATTTVDAPLATPRPVEESKNAPAARGP